MTEKNVNLDLMAFIETEILPRYSNFDKAHRLPHVTNVIRRSVKLATTIGADVNMAYAIAAYHDLGLEGPRAIHDARTARHAAIKGIHDARAAARREEKHDE